MNWTRNEVKPELLVSDLTSRLIRWVFFCVALVKNEALLRLDSVYNFGHRPFQIELFPVLSVIING